MANLGRIGSGFGRLGGLVGVADPAASIFASYGTPGILLGDLNPARLMPSGLSPSYLESTGLTPAGSSGQTLGLLLERSGGAAVGAELHPDGGFDVGTVPTGWTQQAGDGTLSVVSGELTLTTGTISGRAEFAISGLTVGRWLKIAYSLPAATSSWSAVELAASAGGSAVASGSSATQGSGAQSLWGRITATTMYFVARRNGGGNTCKIDNVSIREVVGNHLTQATSADEPTLVLDSGIWRLRGDGLTKNFLTPLVPAASMTMIVACEFNAVNDVVIGCTSGAGGCRLGTDGSGRLAATVGSQDETTITGGSDIRDVVGIAVLRFNASLVTLKWKPLSSSMSGVYGPSAMAGTIPTSAVMRVAGYETSGIAARPLNGDIYRLYAQQAYLSDAEISAIASQWSRELGGTG